MCNTYPIHNRIQSLQKPYLARTSRSTQLLSSWLDKMRGRIHGIGCSVALFMDVVTASHDPASIVALEQYILRP